MGYVRLGLRVERRLRNTSRRDEIVAHLVRLVEGGYVLEAEWIGLGKDLGLIDIIDD